MQVKIHPRLRLWGSHSLRNLWTLLKQWDQSFPWVRLKIESCQWTVTFAWLDTQQEVLRLKLEMRWLFGSWRHTAWWTWGPIWAVSCTSQYHKQVKIDEWKSFHKIRSTFYPFFCHTFHGKVTPDASTPLEKHCLFALISHVMVQCYLLWLLSLFWVFSSLCSLPFCQLGLHVFLCSIHATCVSMPVLWFLAAHFWLFPPLDSHWLWSLHCLQGAVTGSSPEEGKVGCWCAPTVPRWSWWASRNEPCRRLSPGALERAHTEAVPAEEEKAGEKNQPSLSLKCTLQNHQKESLGDQKGLLEKLYQFSMSFFPISNKSPSVSKALSLYSFHNTLCGCADISKNVTD